MPEPTVTRPDAFLVSLNVGTLELIVTDFGMGFPLGNEFHS